MFIYFDKDYSLTNSEWISSYVSLDFIHLFKTDAKKIIFIHLFRFHVYDIRIVLNGLYSTSRKEYVKRWGIGRINASVTARDQYEHVHIRFFIS